MKLVKKSHDYIQPGIVICLHTVPISSDLLGYYASFADKNDIVSVMILETIVNFLRDRLCKASAVFIHNQVADVHNLTEVCPVSAGATPMVRYCDQDYMLHFLCG